MWGLQWSWKSVSIYDECSPPQQTIVLGLSSRGGHAFHSFEPSSPGGENFDFQNLWEKREAKGPRMAGMSLAQETLNPVTGT